jgi:hypothetical protein
LQLEESPLPSPELAPHLPSHTPFLVLRLIPTKLECVKISINPGREDATTHSSEETACLTIDGFQ